jgi:hypothetical protein
MPSRIVLAACLSAVIFTAWSATAYAKPASLGRHASTTAPRFAASAECLQPIESSYINPFSWAQWSSSGNNRRRKEHRYGRSEKGFGANLAVAMALMSRRRIAGVIASKEGATTAAAPIAFKHWLPAWRLLVRIVAKPGTITIQMG